MNAGSNNLELEEVTGEVELKPHVSLIVKTRCSNEGSKLAPVLTRVLGKVSCPFLPSHASERGRSVPVLGFLKVRAVTSVKPSDLPPRELKPE